VLLAILRTSVLLNMSYYKRKIIEVSTFILEFNL